MNKQLTEIQLTSDADNFYIGYIVEKNQELTTMICLDDDGNEGGIEIFKNSAIAKEITASEDITFYQYIIDRGMSKDPFNLSQRNKAILQERFANFNEALLYALKSGEIISLDASNGLTYSGLITAVSDQEIRLRQRHHGLGLETFALAIPISKINCLDLNDTDNLQFDNWLQDEEHDPNNINLVQIYLNYHNDDRYGEAIIGKIIAQTNHHRILVEKYNEIGQIQAMTLVNYDHILHITKQSPLLDYIAYLIKQNEKAGIRDPFGLIDMIRMSGSIFNLKHLPTIEHVLDWEQQAKNLIAVDDIDFASENIGIISKHNQEKFSQIILNGYEVAKQVSYHLNNIAAIDITSGKLLQLQLFTDEERAYQSKKNK